MTSKLIKTNLIVFTINHLYKIEIFIKLEEKENTRKLENYSPLETNPDKSGKRKDQLMREGRSPNKRASQLRSRESEANLLPASSSNSLRKRRIASQLNSPSKFEGDKSVKTNKFEHSNANFGYSPFEIKTQ